MLLLYEQVTVVTAVPPCSAVSVAELVRFNVPPFDAALTVKFWVPPDFTLAEVGLIEIESITIKTVAVAVELKACELAVIVEVPGATPAKIPVFALIEATVAGELDQETPLLI